MRKILVTVPVFELPECATARALLKEAGIEYVYCPVGGDQQSLFGENIASVEGVIVASEPWDADMIRKAKSLKIISRFGVGYDAVDLKAARTRGIYVTNTRVKEIINGVAELAVGFIICALRDIPRLCAEAKKGNWLASRGSILEGKTVGLIGFGAIARATARLLMNFNVHVIACDLFPDEAAAQALNVTLMDMESVLKNSDIVSLHVPSDASTRHIMSKAQFALMKPSASLINTSRGALIDEAALFEALKDGVISRAVVDVFEQEPTGPDNPLLKLDNFLCTPHVGGNCGEAIATNALASVQNVIDCFAGRALSTLVNP